MTAADAVAQILEEKNVRFAFGIIGAGNVALFDAIARRGFTEIICCHHEQAAVMAAAFAGRVAESVGVAIVTTGAGSSNAVTGALAAKMDSVPVVIISGNEPSRYMLTENRVVGVQGYHTKRVAQHVCKSAVCTWEYQNDLPLAEVVRLAFVEAADTRPGPVWIDVPRDHFNATV